MNQTECQLIILQVVTEVITNPSPLPECTRETDDSLADTIFCGTEKYLSSAEYF